MDPICEQHCVPRFFGHNDGRTVMREKDTNTLCGKSRLVTLPSNLTEEVIRKLKKDFFGAMRIESPPYQPFGVHMLGGEVVCKLQVFESLEYDPQSRCEMHNCMSELKYRLYLFEKHVLTVKCLRDEQPRISFIARKNENVCAGHVLCIKKIFARVLPNEVTCGPSTGNLDGPSFFVRLPLNSILSHGKIGEIFPLIRKNPRYQSYSDENFRVSDLGPEISCRLRVAPASLELSTIATCPIHNRRSMHTYDLYRKTTHVCTIQWSSSTPAQITQITHPEPVTQDEVIAFLRDVNP